MMRSAATAGRAIGLAASSPACLAPGPQVGFIIPISTTTQGYLNIKGYKEFENQNRPDGWNVWLTFVLSPAEQTASAPPRRMITK